MHNHQCWVLVQPIAKVVTGCCQARLVATVHVCSYSLYMSGVHLKSKLSYTEKAGVVTSWLLHRDR